MQSVWESLAERYSAYQLALPGSPTFHCQPHSCDAYCCRAYSVSLGQPEAERMERASGKTFIEFLECEDGEPITLPLAQPYLLRRENNRCAQLNADLSCGEYEGRPNACRLYPHFVLFIDTASGRPVHSEIEGMRASLDYVFGNDAGPYLPLLLRHTECPGFTGAPMTAPEWRQLLITTAALQYPIEA
jgi:Fe-S-cluster containining protein